MSVALYNIFMLMFNPEIYKTLNFPRGSNIFYWELILIEIPIGTFKTKFGEVQVIEGKNFLSGKRCITYFVIKKSNLMVTKKRK